MPGLEGDGLSEPDFREIAEELIHQATEEARVTAQLGTIANRLGLSRETGRTAFLDEQRRKYDRIVRAHQLFVLMIPYQDEVLALLERKQRLVTSASILPIERMLARAD